MGAFIFGEAKRANGPAHSCAGERWIERYLEEYWRVTWKIAKFSKFPRAIRFKFGNGQYAVTKFPFKIPVFLTPDVEGESELAALGGESNNDQQPLISRESQARLGLVIDLQENTAWSKLLKKRARAPNH